MINQFVTVFVVIFVNVS